MFRFLLRTAAISIVCNLFLIAQTEQEIKLSGEYYWGEGEHDSEDNAKSAAMQDMLFKIQVTVRTELTTELQETDQQVREDARSLVQAHTQVTLKGLNFLSTTRRGRFRVIAYISKKEYQKSIDILAAEIAADAASIELDEQSKGLDRTLTHYYLTYLKAFQCPKPVKFTTLRGKQYDNIQIYLKNKIESYLADLQITVDKVIIDASIPMITIPVGVSYGTKPVSRIQARLNHQDGAEMIVVDGSVKFFLYTLPSKLKEEYEIITSVYLDPKNTPEDLIRMDQTFKLTYPKKIAIDYSDIVKLNFNVYRQTSGAMLFTPIYTNISISAFEWDFGDGEMSSSQKPLHTYSEKNDHIVSLTFNNNPDLRIMKTLSPDGKATPYTPPQSQPQPQPHIISHPILKDLSESLTFDDLSRKLALYKKKRQLMYGKENTFLKPENCYVFIINPQTKEVLALLDKGHAERQNMLTGESVKEITRQYRGMVTIYTEVY